MEKSKKQDIYTVEYELSGVIFYKNVTSFSFNEAKQQIQSNFLDAKIRAVTILENEVSDNIH
ncbi:hypothetical protein P5G62_011225 [Neobacillus sp. 179-C4.2 HS]|uniref:Uncharacterized protein n=1 Tax=Neobacillus driksii TaxID=3035913 RepID=A0ABV4YTM1_9BACI|nr:hypothetical protein [Neobacillus sp. 179.-C4.2 HS]MDP5194203.1 hypothetical protein [Neobacillus sp. 179.-C4.2 HS]